MNSLPFKMQEHIANLRVGVVIHKFIQVLKTHCDIIVHNLIRQRVAGSSFTRGSAVSLWARHVIFLLSTGSTQENLSPKLLKKCWMVRLIDKSA